MIYLSPTISIGMTASPGVTSNNKYPLFRLLLSGSFPDKVIRKTFPQEAHG